MIMKTYFDSKNINLINAWINQSEATSNDYLKFMSNWIAFNAICYNLFSKDAILERVNFNKGRNKLTKIKSSIQKFDILNAEETLLELKNEKIEINIRTPERLNFSISKRYTEDLIFQKFVKFYFKELKISQNYFDALKLSLLKGDRSYVIVMSRIDLYEKLLLKEPIDFEKFINRNLIVECDTNNLKSIYNVLYQIRCNIFHGEKVPGEINDDRIVSYANPILKEIVMYLVKDNKIY